MPKITQAPEADAPNAPTERAATNLLKSAHLGEIVRLMLATERFRTMPLSKLESLVIPGIATGQYGVLEADDPKAGARRTVAAGLWAYVSQDVEVRLIEDEKSGRQSQLTPAEWVSGDRPRLVLAIGEQKAVEALLVELKKNLFERRS